MPTPKSNKDFSKSLPTKDKGGKISMLDTAQGYIRDIECALTKKANVNDASIKDSRYAYDDTEIVKFLIMLI
jgi:hypothetical protein|tara:strand:+ start:98 stop:313 length:216 start_codon:yes stop_codon:yes gene_type:complete